eukprot:SM000024S07877  [mRNA]  locus=s24:911264:911946:- [translate_table: standard]
MRLARADAPEPTTASCWQVHRLVVNRDPKYTNFVEFRTHKVIYRRYAGLFFSLCVDLTDNELAYLESIHLFVEILDHFFSNVCELDLVFNFHKVGPLLSNRVVTVHPDQQLCASREDVRSLKLLWTG